MGGEVVEETDDEYVDASVAAVDAHEQVVVFLDLIFLYHDHGALTHLSSVVGDNDQTLDCRCWR